MHYSLLPALVLVLPVLSAAVPFDGQVELETRHLQVHGDQVLKERNQIYAVESSALEARENHVLHHSDHTITVEARATPAIQQRDQRTDNNGNSDASHTESARPSETATSQDTHTSDHNSTETATNSHDGSATLTTDKGNHTCSNTHSHGNHSLVVNGNCDGTSSTTATGTATSISTATQGATSTNGSVVNQQSTSEANSLVVKTLALTLGGVFAISYLALV